MRNALLHEVFASIQGEGPWVGERQIFVRFHGCNLMCRYCDTPATVHTEQGSTSPPSSFRAQTTLDVSSPHEHIANPCEGLTLTGLCDRLAVPMQAGGRPVISLTGGEPLMQVDFLESWLPGLRDRYRVYLETNGVLWERMQRLRGLIDVVSMDLKIPSSTGLSAFWDEHRRFLDAIGAAQWYGKIIVTQGMRREELLTAVGLIAEQNPAATLVLQPAFGPDAPDIAMVLRMQDAALHALSDVRVIPQVHRILNVP